MKLSISSFRAYITFFPFLTIAITGCSKKSSQCIDITVTATSKIEAGETIYLKISSRNNIGNYYWWGPNDFSSNEAEPRIERAQAANAGKYYLRVNTYDGCTKEFSTDSVIVNVTAAPCTPANNTAVLAGVSTLNFTAVSSFISGGSYFITSNNIEIEFPGTTKPSAGVYSIQPLSGTWLWGNVRVRFITQNSNWPSTGTLYVTVNNGKISATFCSIATSAQTYTYKTTATGKITEQ